MGYVMIVMSLSEFSAKQIRCLLPQNSSFPVGFQVYQWYIHVYQHMYIQDLIQQPHSSVCHFGFPCMSLLVPMVWVLTFWKAKKSTSFSTNLAKTSRTRTTSNFTRTCFCVSTNPKMGVHARFSHSSGDHYNNKTWITIWVRLKKPWWHSMKSWLVHSVYIYIFPI